MLLMVVIVLLLFFTMPLCKCCANMFVGGGCTKELEDIVVGMALEGPTIHRNNQIDIYIYISSNHINLQY